MESIYDIMKDRLQVTEPTFLVTILSGPRQGDRTIYNQDGDILYGDAIEGFTLNRVKPNALCVFGSTECFGVYLMLSKSMMRIIIGVGLFGHAANLIILIAGGLYDGDIPII